MRATDAVSSPMGPAPITATVSPRRILVNSKICRITANGSRTVAAAKVMLSGIGTTLRCGITA